MARSGKTRRTAGHAAALVTRIIVLLQICALSPVTTADGVAVTNEAELNAALLDAQATLILLTLGSDLLISAKHPVDGPILLNRSVIIQGAGNDTGWSAWPRLDFNFASRDRLLLLPGVTLTFRRLAILNLFSRSQQSYDYFASSASSSSSSSITLPVVVWQDVVDRRMLCPPLPVVVDTWRATPRPVTAGGTSTNGSSSSSQVAQQSVILDTTPVCDDLAGTSGMSGRCFTPVMRASDVQADTSQGFRIRWNNTLTLCERFLPDACIQQQGLEGCYLTSMETLLAQRAQSQQTTDSKSSDSSGDGGGGLSPGAQTGLIVGCVVGGVLLAAGVALYLWQRHRRSDGEAVVAGHVLAAYASHDKDGTARSEDLESGLCRGDTADTRGPRPSTSLHHPTSSDAASANAGRLSNAGGGGGVAAPKGRRGSSTDAGTLDSSCPITDCTTRGSGGLRASAPISAEVSAPGGGACAGAAALGLGGSTSGEVAAALAAAGVRSGDWRAVVAAVAAKAGQAPPPQQQHAGLLGDSVGSIGSGMLVLGGASSSRVAAFGGPASGSLGGGAGRTSGAVPTAANASTNPLFSLPEVEQGAGSADPAGSPTSGTPTAATAAAADAAAAAAAARPELHEPRVGTHTMGTAGSGTVLISTTAAAAAAAASPGAGAGAAAGGGTLGGSMQSGSFKLLTRLRSLIHRGGSRTPTTAGGTTASGSGATAAASPGSAKPTRAKSATLSGGEADGCGSGGAGGGSPLARAPSGATRAASAGMHGLAGLLKGLRLGHGMTSDGGSTGTDSTPTAAGVGTPGARAVAAAAAAAAAGQAGAGRPSSSAAPRDAVRPPTRLSLQVSLASGDAHAHALAAARGSNASAVSGVTGRPSLCEMQRELERIEGELHKEEYKRSRSKGAAPRARSGRRSLGSGSPSAAAATAAVAPGAEAGAAGAAAANNPAARKALKE